MDKMQREFEQWAVNFKGTLNLPLFVLKDEDGVYTDGMARMAWIAWQASRAALVVELPEYVADSAIRNKAIDEIKTKLDKAGIKYK